MTPNNYFDNIFCLNLNRRHDRWNSISKQFKREGIFVERIEAIDGNNIKVLTEFESLKRNLKNIKINKNVFATLKSYQKIFNIILERNIEKSLIFEDDILF